jgi:hypothetical protein
MGTMLDTKQVLFFKALKSIKDSNVEVYSSYLYPQSKLASTTLKREYKHLQTKLNTEEAIASFKKIQNEIIEAVMYEFMELIDGYKNLDYKLDLIDKQTKESIKKNIQLHDCFMDYLAEVEEDY